MNGTQSWIRYPTLKAGTADPCSVVVHAVSLIRNPLIRNSPEDSWKNRKWNPEPFEPKVQNKK